MSQVITILSDQLLEAKTKALVKERTRLCVEEPTTGLAIVRSMVADLDSNPVTDSWGHRLMIFRCASFAVKALWRDEDSAPNDVVGLFAALAVQAWAKTMELLDGTVLKERDALVARLDLAAAALEIWAPGQVSTALGFVKLGYLARADRVRFGHELGTAVQKNQLDDQFSQQLYNVTIGATRPILWAVIEYDFKNGLLQVLPFEQPDAFDSMGVKAGVMPFDEVIFERTNNGFVQLP